MIFQFIYQFENKISRTKRKFTYQIFNKFNFHITYQIENKILKVKLKQNKF